MQPQPLRLPHSGLTVPHDAYTVTAYTERKTHDGVAFTGTLRLNGKIIGTVENDGVGGPDTFHSNDALTRGVKVTSGMDPRLNQSGPTLIVLAEHKPPVYGTGGITLATSSVLLNACTSPWGRRRTKPTVSVSSTGSPPGNERRRVVGSRVANKRSSTSTPASVSRLSNVDLPALV